MDPLNEKVVRHSFVNCTKGEASRLRLPLDFGELPWEDLDFLGWVDPGALLRSHIVMPGPDGPRGITLRVSSAARKSAVKSSMCQICFTGHASTGVNLFVAPLAGPAGRQGNTVGVYACADLACSLYLRGKRQPKLRFGRYEESLTLDERIARAMDNLNKFADKVVGAA
ncbi:MULTISPECIES: FBP domain-containing protein [unclassified Streptomyces]|uniref:FBP domain-containing protein n=1 Tax=unclassified Streptomyces TaxID=2593676 RepID=UPI00333480ED